MTPESSFDAVSDDALLARIATGEAEAFAALFRRRQAVVYRFTLHMTGSTSIAEDVTQEVFLAVMRDAARYERGRSGVTAWLCGIARNHARRRLESDRRIVSFDGPDDGELDVAAEVAHPLEDLSKAEAVEALRRAILTLPLHYREALVLCDLQELSYEAAAGALGCAVGTVRSRLHRGRALLSSKLSAGRVAARDSERAHVSTRVEGACPERAHVSTRVEGSERMLGASRRGLA